MMMMMMMNTYSKYASVALVFQFAMRMRTVTLTSGTCLAGPHFFTVSHKRHDFRNRYGT
jgi:hypothetical protein